MLEIMLKVILLSMLQTGTVVTTTDFVRWDDGNPGLPTETFVYLERSPGVIPDGLPDATVGTGLLEWAITAASGQWHAAVTAFDPVSGLESGPSNEIQFWVLGPPGNARVAIWFDSHDRLRIAVLQKPRNS